MDDHATNTVLLIHGTFAANESDAGSAWWQRDSDFARGFQQRLPPRARLAEKTFHWSGENSEWARYQAGKKLLEQLRRFEAHGHSYHLVGHSHGGSVIWHALRLATRRRIELRHLRSWCTVGTPFLHFKPVASLLNSLLLGGLCWALATLILAVALIHVEPWVREHVPRFYLVAVMAGGMWVVGGAAFLVYVGLRNLYSVVESHHARSDCRVARKAMKHYGGRWLGLWSSEDEAIGGLRHSVQFKAQFLTKHGMLATELPFLSERPVAGVCFRATAKLANVSFIPTLRDVLFSSIDEQFCGVISRLCQGNNRPGTIVERVTVGPIPADKHAYRPLPPAVDQDVIRNANACAAATIGNVRRAFGRIALGADWQMSPMLNALTGKELVHTSYFTVLGVQQLLCLHVAAHIYGDGLANLDLFRRAIPGDLIDWYRGFRDALTRHVLERPAKGVAPRDRDDHTPPGDRPATAGPMIEQRSLPPEALRAAA